jgi:hypothetical protein
MVAAFAVAMAWVESACVYYLRVLVDRVDPYQAAPLPLHGALGQIEVAREAATLLMIAVVGALAGRSRSARLGHAAIAFGLWDIFYYVFLRLFDQWPRSLFDWDILFLLPLPWWGPVLAPVSIALVLVVGGTLATRDDGATMRVARRWWWTSWVGAVLALYVFMADALRALSGGVDVTTVLPHAFNWPAFWLALALMAAPVVALGYPGHGTREPEYLPTPR